MSFSPNTWLSNSTEFEYFLDSNSSAQAAKPGIDLTNLVLTQQKSKDKLPKNRTLKLATELVNVLEFILMMAILSLLLFLTWSLEKRMLDNLKKTKAGIEWVKYIEGIWATENLLRDIHNKKLTPPKSR